MSEDYRLSGNPEKLLASILRSMASLDPFIPVSDLVQNGVDAKAKNIDIEIRRVKNDGTSRIATMIIRDDGQGFSESFEHYIRNISDSIKKKSEEYVEYSKSAVNVRGEFDLGMQGFRSISKWMYVVNKTENQDLIEMHKQTDPDIVKMSEVRVMRFRAITKEGDIDLGARIMSFENLLDELRDFTDRKALEHVRESHGVTYILKDISESASKLLTLKRIRAFLADKQREALLKKLLRITINDGGKIEEVNATRYIGDKQIFEVGYPGEETDQSKKGYGRIRAELYFYNNQKSGRRVQITIKGDPIYLDITKVDEFAHSPWDSGLVEGIVEYDKLNTEPGRRAIYKDGNWEAFLKMMGELEKKVDTEIKKKTSVVRSRQNQKILDKLRETFRNVRRETNLKVPGYGDGVSKSSLDHFELLPPDNFVLPVLKARDIWVIAYDEDNHSLTEKDGIEISWSVLGILGESVTPKGLKALFVAGSVRGETKVKATVKDTKAGVELSDYLDVSIVFPRTPGPLFRARIYPLITRMKLDDRKHITVIAEDQNGEQIDNDLKTEWTIENIDSEARIESFARGEVVLWSGNKIGSFKLKVKIRQGHIVKEDFVIISVVIPEKKEKHSKGINLPPPTFDPNPIEAKRHSHLESNGGITNFIIYEANEDYRRASNDQETKREYIMWLYVKEFVLFEFKQSYPSNPQYAILLEELLERQLGVLCSAERNF